jgi:hypothetical protein
MNPSIYPLKTLDVNSYNSLLESGKTLMVKTRFGFLTHVATANKDDIPKGYRKATIDDLVKLGTKMIPKAQTDEELKTLRGKTESYGGRLLGELKNSNKITTYKSKKSKISNFGTRVNSIVNLTSSISNPRAVGVGERSNLGKDQIKALLKFKVNPNLKIGRESKSLLHFLAEAGAVKAVKKLCEAGADPSIRDSGEETPLHKAARRNHFLVIKVLIKYKPDINAVNNLEETPLDLLQSASRTRGDSTTDGSLPKTYEPAASKRILQEALQKQQAAEAKKQKRAITWSKFS